MIERPATKYKAARGSNRLPAARCASPETAAKTAPDATKSAAATGGTRRSLNWAASAVGLGRAAAEPRVEGDRGPEHPERAEDSPQIHARQLLCRCQHGAHAGDGGRVRPAARVGLEHRRRHALERRDDLRRERRAVAGGGERERGGQERGSGEGDPEVAAGRHGARAEEADAGRRNQGHDAGEERHGERLRQRADRARDAEDDRRRERGRRPQPPGIRACGPGAPWARRRTARRARRSAGARRSRRTTRPRSARRAEARSG